MGVDHPFVRSVAGLTRDSRVFSPHRLGPLRKLILGLTIILLPLLVSPRKLIANEPPSIGPIADWEVIQDQPTEAIALALSDSETSVLGLRLSGSSSNPALVPVEN